MKNSELEKLIAQRKEIDKQIKALQSLEVEVDGAKLIKRYGDSWAVLLQEINTRACVDRTWQNKQIAIAKTREEAIEHLVTLIDTLAQLYSKVKNTGEQK